MKKAILCTFILGLILTFSACEKNPEPTPTPSATNSTTTSSSETPAGSSTHTPDCNHVYQPEITTAATCTSNGIVTYRCTLCQDSYTENTDMVAHKFINGICEGCNAADPDFVSLTNGVWYWITEDTNYEFNLEDYWDGFYGGSCTLTILQFYENGRWSISSSAFVLTADEFKIVKDHFEAMGPFPEDEVNPIDMFEVIELNGKTYAYLDVLHAGFNEAEGTYTVENNIITMKYSESGYNEETEDLDYYTVQFAFNDTKNIAIDKVIVSVEYWPGIYIIREDDNFTWTNAYEKK